MFGESGAVYGFNRLSKFVSVLAARGPALVASGFHDDFTQIERSPLLASVHTTFKQMLEALGLEVATEAKNNKPFANKFNVLGLEMNLEGSVNDVV